MQSRLRSLLEAVSITIIGIAYAVPLNYLAYTRVQWSSTWSMAFWVTIWFTAIGMAFKYAMRRFFNWLDQKYPSQ